MKSSPKATNPDDSSADGRRGRLMRGRRKHADAKAVGMAPGLCATALEQGRVGVLNLWPVGVRRRLCSRAVTPHQCHPAPQPNRDRQETGSPSEPAQLGRAQEGL